jgi:hypothetical protein
MIPKEVRDLGVGELDIDVLNDTWETREKRKFYPGKNVPVDRAYKNLAALGLIKWTQWHPHQTSLSDDRYLITNEGRDVLRIVQGAAKALAQKKRSEAGIGQALERQTDITEFRHLINGHYFKFVSDEESEGPSGGRFAPTYVKTGERSYVSPLAPNTGSKYTHRVGGKAPVRIVKSYPTHAFPNPKY